jgi:signal transduction histidine kinase
MAEGWARVDVVLSLGLTASALAEATLGLTGDREPWYVAAMVPLATLPVLFRRTRPLPAVLCFLAALLGLAVAGSDLPGGFTLSIALVLMLYAAGSRIPLQTSLVVLAFALLVLTMVIALGADPHPANFIYMGVVVSAAWAAGSAVRMTEERGRLLAEQQAMKQRTRIAGELHDVVSHSVSAIVVQAAAERRDQPEDSSAAQTLSDIEHHGRQTLTELRRLLGVLRIDDQGPPLAPQPGIDELDEIVRSARAAGVAATVQVEGDPQPADAGLSLAAYRLVQEAVTNVRKHSSATCALVVLRWRATELEVEVSDPGPARHLHHVPGAGFGLRAMVDRAHAFGGTVEAGPLGDGFRVRAVLPLQLGDSSRAAGEV